MFHMAKYVGAHVEPFKPVDLTPKVKDPNKPRKKRKNAKDDKKGKGGKRGKRVKKEPGEKRKTPTSFTAPFRLSHDLQNIVGKEIMSRPQVTAALWTYIKANNMQVSFFVSVLGVYQILIRCSSSLFCLITTVMNDRIQTTSVRSFVMRNFPRLWVENVKLPCSR